MRRNDRCHREWQENQLIPPPYFFGNQQNHSAHEQQPGRQPVVVTRKTMPERPGTDGKSQPDHAVFKQGMTNKAQPEQGQKTDGERQQRAMNSAEDGSKNP